MSGMVQIDKVFMAGMRHLRVINDLPHKGACLPVRPRGGRRGSRAPATTSGSGRPCQLEKLTNGKRNGQAGVDICLKCKRPRCKHE